MNDLLVCREVCIFCCANGSVRFYTALPYNQVSLVCRDHEKRRKYDQQIRADGATEVDLDDIPYQEESQTFSYKAIYGNF